MLNFRIKESSKKLVILALYVHTNFNETILYLKIKQEIIKIFQIIINKLLLFIEGS